MVLRNLISLQVVESPCDAILVADGAPLSAFQYFENVRNFLVAIQEMGFPTFEASDLEQVCCKELDDFEISQNLQQLLMNICFFLGRKCFSSCELCFGNQIV